MKINLDRLCKLAGVESNQESTLNEASNRSMHDEAALSGEDEHRFGKGQLAEEQKYGGNKGDESRSRRDYMGETVEVNEEMIAREIALMRKERLQENELRKIIRAEIGSIMKGIKKESTKEKTARRSSNLKKGVTMGMLGPGFR